MTAAPASLRGFYDGISVAGAFGVVLVAHKTGQLFVDRFLTGTSTQTTSRAASFRDTENLRRGQRSALVHYLQQSLECRLGRLPSQLGSMSSWFSW